MLTNDGQLPLRPDNTVQRVGDLIKADFTGTRTLYGNKVSDNCMSSKLNVLIINCT